MVADTIIFTVRKDECESVLILATQIAPSTCFMRSKIINRIPCGPCLVLHPLVDTCSYSPRITRKISRPLASILGDPFFKVVMWDRHIIVEGKVINCPRSIVRMSWETSGALQMQTCGYTYTSRMAVGTSHGRDSGQG